MLLYSTLRSLLYDSIVALNFIKQHNIGIFVANMLPTCCQIIKFTNAFILLQDKIKRRQTIKYANVNFWRGISKERRYNYHHKKLYRLMEGNTCAIQAQLKDVMLDTLDYLVQGFTVYIKGEKVLFSCNQQPFACSSIVTYLCSEQFFKTRPLSVYFQCYNLRKSHRREFLVMSTILLNFYILKG